MAKPTWISTQSPTSTLSPSWCTSPMFMFLRTPPTSALASNKSSSRISTIRPGIPKHIRLLSLVSPEKHVCQYCLSQGKPTIVSRHPPVPVGNKPFLLQQSYHLPEKKHILKSPPGERDRVYSTLLPN